MNSKRLKFGLPFVCVGGVHRCAVFVFRSSPEQGRGSSFGGGQVHPGDCSFARGIEGKDFVRDAYGAHCRMPVVTFRRLYPEIAQHVDESTWE